MRPLNAALLALWLAAGAASASTPAIDCQAALQQARAAELQRSYKEFDQTPGRGWRALDDSGCTAAAAALLSEYLKGHGFQARIMNWHLVQLYAMLDDRASALAHVERALDPGQSTQQADFNWNDYVLATAAFLRRDSAAFARHRTELVNATQRSSHNRPNLMLVEKMAKCFQSTYAEAMKCPE